MSRDVPSRALHIDMSRGLSAYKSKRIRHSAVDVAAQMHIPLHIWLSLDQSQKPEALEIELIDEIIQTAIPLMSHNHLLGGRNTLEAGGSGEVWSRNEASQRMAKVGITQYLLSPFQKQALAASAYSPSSRWNILSTCQGLRQVIAKLNTQSIEFDERSWARIVCKYSILHYYHELTN